LKICGRYDYLIITYLIKSKDFESIYESINSVTPPSRIYLEEAVSNTKWLLGLI